MSAKIIYSAKIVKESAQKEEITGDGIPHPYDPEKGDLISYYHTLPTLNSYHSRSIAIKAACTVNLGIEVIEGNETEIMDRLSNVNEDGESFLEVMHRVALDFETTANGYLECVKSKGGTIEELYFCPAIKTYRKPRKSDTAFIYRGTSGETKYHRFDSDNLNDNSLIHFRQPTTASRYYGMPEWSGIVPEIELDYYLSLYAKGFFLNSGIPDLAIVVEGGTFDDETEKQVVEFVQQNFKGPENYHRTLYLPINDKDVKVRFEKLAPDNAWSAPIEKMREGSRDRVLSGHGVPPRLAGVVTAGQLGGGSEAVGQIAIFKETTIAPRQRLFEVKANQVISAMGINGKIKFTTLSTPEEGEETPSIPGVPNMKEIEKHENIVLLKHLQAVRESL